MFFDSWYELGRMLLVGGMTYAFLLMLLRLTGKRTLSKLNAFDFIVTIALGSTVATIIVSGSITVSEGVLALVLLSSLQFLITASSVRIPWLRRLVTSRPTLVYREGFLESNMQRERVTRSEILQAIRSRGIGALEDVDAVVLETNGELSVLAGCAGDSQVSTLRDVAE